eukprot:GAHX01000785.1.p2 GENE.GAHX01000785.1~~GAHX01000785.1.p2  ORF type:complete len:233 (+),score=41.08 GAHX01000785.1:34-732(+)
MNEACFSLINAPYRIDGRLPHDIRPLRIRKITNTQSPNISILFEQGPTKIVCSLNELCPRVHKSSSTDGLTLVCTYRSSSDLYDHLTEARALISIFTPVIRLQEYPRSELGIHVNILEEDGPSFAKVINAVNIALVLSGIELNSFIVATEIGVFNSYFFNDLNDKEERRPNVEKMVLVTDNDDRIVYTEFDNLKIDKLEELLDFNKSVKSYIEPFIKKFISDNLEDKYIRDI